MTVLLIGIIGSSPNEMLSMMSEPTVGVSAVIPGLDGTFSDKNIKREDGVAENKNPISTVSERVEN